MPPLGIARIASLLLIGSGLALLLPVKSSCASYAAGVQRVRAERTGLKIEYIRQFRVGGGLKKPLPLSVQAILLVDVSKKKPFEDGIASSAVQLRGNIVRVFASGYSPHGVDLNRFDDVPIIWRWSGSGTNRLKYERYNGVNSVVETVNFTLSGAIQDVTAVKTTFDLPEDRKVDGHTYQIPWTRLTTDIADKVRRGEVFAVIGIGPSNGSMSFYTAEINKAFY